MKKFIVPRLMTWALAALPFFFIACDEEEAPAKEDTPELVTQLKLTFTPPVGEGEPIKVTATDEDIIGPLELTPDGPISLKLNTSYTLTIELFNELADPTEPEYDITEEILEEADEHMFFFSWGGVFVNPAGDGNIDNRDDAVNYEDNDNNGLPLGLSTSWQTTTVATAEKKFRIVLKHQPGLKSATSTVEDGETDIDIEFELEVD